MTSQLPCDGDGVCMVCKSEPPEFETLLCKTCITPWHVNCLSKALESLSSTLQWDCPDCSVDNLNAAVGAAAASSSSELVGLIRAIESDTTLTDHQKAKKRQELISGIKASDIHEDGNEEHKNKKRKKEGDVLSILHDKLMCLICMELPHRPVTTPCGHNFCLKCFEKWVKQEPRKQSCPECRSKIPDSMVNEPRINSALVVAIRLAKEGKDSGSGSHRHILAENDTRNRGSVLIGKYGAQSVALSGDFEDDDNHGDWFLFTGSGGRDLSGNDQSFEKSNEALHVSCLRGYPVRVVRSHKEKRSSYAPLNGLKCGVYRIEKCWRKIGIQGHKVCRYLFVRCDNEPAPWSSGEHGDRPRPLPVIKELKGATDVTERKDSPSWDYDEEDSCWKWKKPLPRTTKKSECVNNLQTTQKAAVCKVNHSPWDAISVEDYYQDKGLKVLEKENGDNSKKLVRTENSVDSERKRKAWEKAQNESDRNQLLNALKCQLCRQVMNLPLTTPCAHNFCKLCLEGVFTGKSSVKKRYFCEGRSLRAQKAIMKCPLCTMDLSEFLLNPQVNREVMSVIEDLQCQDEEENDEDSSEETESFDKPENMIGVSKDGRDISDKLDDILEIEGEPKQMNKRLKTKALDVSGNADGYDFNSDDSVEEMLLDVAKDRSDISDKLDDILEIDGEPRQMNKRLKAKGSDLSGNADGSESKGDISVEEMKLDVAKDGSENSDMLDDISQIEGQPKQMNRCLKAKGSELSGIADGSKFKSDVSVEEMKLDVADGGNVVTNNAVVETLKTLATEAKPKHGSRSNCLPKPKQKKRGLKKMTEEAAVDVVADEVLKMARGKEMSGGGDTSRTDGTSSNHLIVNRSSGKRCINANKIKALHATPALTVPNSVSTSTTSVNGAGEGVAIEKEGENKGHEVEREQKAINDHMEKRDEDNEEHSPGFIFICSGQTKPECFKYRVFGLPAGKMHVVENIKPGAKLFLFDVNLKLLYGVYKATSIGKRNLEPAAFGGRFPVQVRFSIFKECLPLPESIFRHAIEENYHGGTKFHQQLSNCQVKKLCALFRPIGRPPMSVIGPPPKHSPPVKFYQKGQPSRLRPPTYPYASTAHHHGHGPPPPPMYGYMPSAAQITNTNPYSCVENRRTYSWESAPIPTHYPYTRATSDLVLQGANFSQNEYNLQILLAERKREQEREFVRQFGYASYYS